MVSLLLPIIYIAFISLGLPDSLLGSAWPTMYPELGVPVSCAGILSMIISLGTILSSLQSDRLTRTLGTGRVTAISVGMTAAALFGFSISTQFWMLCLWAIPYGLGAGSVDAALNNYVALHYKSRHMSWLHCITVDALVPVQMFQSLFHVGDGVQHKAVTRCQTERDGGQEVHKALEHAAHVRRDVPRLDQRHVLWWYATLETAASGFIAARHVRKADGKVPLTTHAVVQAAAVAGCNGIRDASFLQILRQRRAEQRDGFHSLKGRFGRFRQKQRLFRCDKRHTSGFRYESRLRHEIPASGKLPDKREDVAALAQAEVVPELFRHVHTEGGRAFTAVWRTIPQLVSAPSDRLMPQPCEKIREGYLPHVFYIRPFHAARIS